MATDPRVLGVTPQKASIGNPRPPAFAFWKGAAVGMVVVLPATAGAVWFIGRLGIGNPNAGFIHVLRLTVVFAGLATVLTAGGVGRLAAQASVEKGGGLARAVRIGARTQAVAGAGLLILAAIPEGDLPHSPWAWAALGAAGAVVGAATGALIGALCGGPAPVTLSDVVAIARWPTDAIVRATVAPFVERRKRPRP
ncbi:MAG: hypothetical protein K8W52_35050 [Deltaproteobacteria bacterium]|nr:hypothetical protein [Deltaproteobacteria bacterium]